MGSRVMCVWKERPHKTPMSSAFPADYTIGCNGEACAGMLNGRPFSYCPFCGCEIESQSDAKAEPK
jgi:hypothetical protein